MCYVWKILIDMKKIILMLLTMLGLNSGCMNAQNNNYTDMDVDGFAKLLQDEKVQLLDVRTPEEFAEGHIPGAENINVMSGNFLAKAEQTLDKSEPVAVYCRSGKRSAEAASILSKNGYKVTNLSGGIMAWIRDRKPIDY